MPLNSLIFKEASGYTAFYHHLLKPKVRSHNCITQALTQVSASFAASPPHCHCPQPVLSVWVHAP